MTDGGEVQSVRVSRVYEADRESVFAAWTEPLHVEAWWAPPGFTEPSAEIDLRAGGRFRIAMVSPDGDPVVAVGEFEVVDRPDRLVYTWSWEGDHPVGTKVTVRFIEAEGGTELDLLHEGFPNEEMAGMHRDGWKGCLERLTEVVGQM